MKRVSVILLLIILFSLVFVYLNTQTKPEPTPQPSISRNKSQETKLDQFLKKNNATQEITEAYKFAYDNPQNVLSIVKCYCGCLKNQGHKNNRDCFFNEDGSFDLMGLNCGLCVKTAIIAKQMLDEGKTVQEISDYVDKRWGKDA